MWEKEEKMIRGLMKLYPEIDSFRDDVKYYAKNFRGEHEQGYWVYLLCTYHLDQRIPILEKYIKRYSGTWGAYRRYFEIEKW